MSTDKTLRRIVAPCVVILGALTFGPRVTLAQPISVIVPTSVRSFGMAATGGADASDPFNSVWNPAVLGSQSGVLGYGFYGDVLSELSDEIDFAGLAVAGGWQFKLSSAVTAGLGGEVRYGRFNWGSTTYVDQFNGPLATFNEQESYYALSLAGQVGLDNGLALALGGTFKPWSGDFADDHNGKATAYDLGALASWAYTDDAGRVTTVAVGVSSLNNGRAITLPATNLLPAQQIDFPSTTNYAVSFRHESKLKPLLNTEVPVAEFTFNFDAEQPSKQNATGGATKSYRFGIEAGAMHIVFARIGWIILQSSDIIPIDAGLGLALPTDVAVFRVDFAVVPLERIGSEGGANVDKRDHKFGFLVEVPFPLGG